MSESVLSARDLRKARWSQERQVKRRSGHHETLVRADVGRRLGTANVLLARLQRERVAAPTFDVSRRAHETPADVIVLDLEDGVAPEGKAAGRAAVRQAIESLKAAGKTVHVRINHIDTGMTKDDLAAIVGPGLDAILYPKPQGASAVRIRTAPLPMSTSVHSAPTKSSSTPQRGSADVGNRVSPPP